MAAQGTTAVLLRKVFFLLSRHPLVWETLRQEALSSPISPPRLPADEPYRPALHHPPPWRRPRRHISHLRPQGHHVRHRLLRFASVRKHLGRRRRGFQARTLKNVQAGHVGVSAVWRQAACLCGQAEGVSEASYAVVRIAREFEKVEGRDGKAWKEGGVDGEECSWVTGGCCGALLGTCLLLGEYL